MIVAIALLTTSSSSSDGSSPSPEPEWVAVGSGTHDILTSVDGLNWQDNAFGTSTFDNGRGIAYGTCNGTPLWVAVGEGTHKILTSVDGLNWQANATGTSTIGGTGVAYGLCNGIPRWVAVGVGTHKILTSVDGLNWQANATGTSTFGNAGSGDYARGVAYGLCNNSSRWVAVGIGTHKILTSVDGLNWQANATGTSTFNEGRGIAYGTSNGTSPLWVAVGSGVHEILTSVDGLNWQDNATGTSTFYNDNVLDYPRAIAYGLCNGVPRWVAVGKGAQNILTSVDGLNWQANATGTSLFRADGTGTGTGIAYGTCNGTPLWVALGEGTHDILTSVDGLNWQANATGTSLFDAGYASVAAKHLLYGMCQGYYTN